MQIDLEDMITEVSNKVLYIHRKKTNNEIFYVGIGSPNRAFNLHEQARSSFWKRTVDKYGVIVEVLETGLTKEEAVRKEIALIRKIGRRDLDEGTLVNHTDGGDGVSGFKNRVIDIETGEVYLNVSIYANYKGLNIRRTNRDVNKGINNLPIRKLTDSNKVKWGLCDTYFTQEVNEEINETNEEVDTMIRQLKSYTINNNKPRKKRQ